jgi:hypothetical protein
MSRELDRLSGFIGERSDILQKELDELILDPESDEWERIVEVNAAQISLLGEIYEYIQTLKSEE